MNVKNVVKSTCHSITLVQVSNGSLHFFLQRTFPLFQDRTVWLEKLCSSQFESQQMLREDRESRGDRKPKEGMPVGHEPEQNHEDGRGDR